MEEEKLTNGQKVISNKDGLVNTETDNPSFMISLDGKPQEESGQVFGGTLAWTGNYLIKMDLRNTQFNVIAGINEETSHYQLEAKEKFVTPEFAMTYSSCGKGGISRAFHRWARKYKLHGGDELHDILLNGWEGVYLKVNQESMEEMMKDFSALGGELFVMDDGWFGNKYPRNRTDCALGDWEVCKEKLPEGIEGLLKSAKKYGIKFGLWIEPEMANTKSELFDKHPDWIMRVANRPLSTYGRKNYEGADGEVSELTCHAMGGRFVFPGLRTVIDIGGQDAKIISLTEDGRMANFVMNDKCAAGTGRFLDVMASILRMDVSELAPCAAQSTQPASISSTCTVFAESEVISQLASGVKRPDLVAGICQSVATRVAALARRAGVREMVCMSGGVAKNGAVRRGLEECLNVSIAYDPRCQHFGAIGAALWAYRQASKA